ncbi:TetR/AcrR family transcriptional regulator [Leucobacter chinensis]|uniref:TetR/AcrR family transcriptional regulator n=1 Tax=Leucobacter chinensis TaxID=2851010 RepID=UPI001C22F215|nr:TetR/AcrR family transcriptional regulator [Leucobacter chinensis]
MTSFAENGQPQAETPAATLRGRAAEARSNDDAVLNAAREVFVEQGFNAPMSAIAERAGVGVASIYRRYQSKDQLTLELRLRALHHVIDIARRIAAEPGDFAVQGFMQRHLAEAASPLATTFGKHVLRDPSVDAAAEELRQALEALIDLDRQRDLVPNDYNAGELMLAITHLRPSIPAERERVVELGLRQLDHYLIGLKHSAKHPEAVRGNPLTWNEWVEFNSAD